ncbi:MAG: phosphatase PAP2 family protein [Roseburia sp.]|nr:phosphatase PAP2 family protein [Roseburia sp.]
MDITYLLILQRIRELLGGVFDGLMLEITSMAEAAPTYLLFAAVYWCADKRAGQYMGWNISLACTWNQFLKAVFKVARPWVRDARIHPVEAAIAAASGYSFPSGHTARAVAAWGAAGQYARKKGRSKDAVELKRLGALGWLLVILIMFSRNYLGVHTPQDVIAALGSGLVIMAVTDRLLAWVDRAPGRDAAACAAGCAFCFIPMLRAGWLSNAGAGMGLLIGWFVERRWVQFRTEGSAARKGLRFCVGAGLMALILFGLRPVLSLLLPERYAGFLAVFALGFYIMAGWPWIFSRWESGKL